MGQPTSKSPWEPLREPLFRALWIAALVSNVGSWMEDVGESWLMMSLSHSSLLVALLQTSDAIPMILLSLPSGALADVVDRRRLLLFTQTWMMVAVASLGVLTLTGAMTPWLLLALTFAIGVGTALNMPAWQAITPEIVQKEQLPAALSLGSLAVNLARSAGPAIAGILVAAMGPGVVFLLNAASFGGVIFVLYRWQRTPRKSALPPEAVLSAIRAGVRYVRHAPELRAILFHAAAFMFCASALWALLPLVARREMGLGSAAYGVLLGGLGIGAVSGAVLLPRVRGKISTDKLVAVAVFLFAAATFTLAWVRVFALVFCAMLVAGVAWMSVLSSFNVAVQTVTPNWVRARALAVYLLIFMGGMAGGSFVWGLVAERHGIPFALMCGSAGLVVGVFVLARFHLSDGKLDLAPSLNWPEPVVTIDPDLEDGPVLVTIEFHIDPARAADFVQATQGLRAIHLRDGAIRWGLFHDTADNSRYVVTFVVESWAEHLRQHERLTKADQEAQDRAFAFNQIGAPAVSHLIAESPE